MLNYKNNKVLNFIAIPHSFFISDIIKKKPFVSLSAKRKGWVDCNILINKIPDSGKIFYIKNRIEIKKDIILNNFNKIIFIKNEDINLINKNEFTTKDIYKYEELLKQNHPNNNFIKEKIRQQLQILRDFGYIEFRNNGTYRLIN